MERRAALQRVGFLLGTTFIATDLFLSGCKSDTSRLTDETIQFNSSKEFLLGIASTIIPAGGKHPGFTASNEIDTLINILNDCYKLEDQRTLQKGLETINTKANEKYKKDFTVLSNEEKYEILNEIDKIYFDKNTKEENKPIYYGMLKESILLTYFTNEKVMTELFAYTKVPGKYDGAHKVESNAYATIYGLGI